ncbi:peptidase S8 [Sorangium cellulosum]|uniref:Peptidase S8 n=1 Tax=Sorangium cellulosum TaxID=56 RepID=A0A2L0EUP0_SORCE|nr:S8 family serine peptidase [Sorangium cellulosum]AUX43011.1 peptidase S8 [Sorangium cellulosum]
MRTRVRWFSLTSLCIALSGCSGDLGDNESGQDNTPPEGPAPGEATFAPEESTELWFVEFERAPAARGVLGKGALLREQRELFRRAAALRGLRYRQRFSFEELWNGLSVRVAREGAEALADLPGVKAVYPVVPLTLDVTRAAAPLGPDLAVAGDMSGADVARRDLGVTGEDIRVGVIDSGIDYHHPDLGGCFGPGCRVAFGHDFVGDDFVAGNTSAQPAPDGDPDDCLGHGTHVAGIVGANGIVQGVAPDVTFGAYRVFGCRGGSRADLILKALEQAAADGMHVVNISIGSPFQWPEYPTAAAANALVARGVVVVASIGNSGAKGLWAAGAPGVGEAVIGTASVDNSRVTRLSFSVAPGDTAVGYVRAAGSPPAPLSGSAPLARTGAPAGARDACAALPAGSLAGAIALIRRGGCPFRDKAAHAQAAGAVGVVFHNDRPGEMSPSVDTGDPITIPVVGITQADGQLLHARLDAGPVTHRWTDRAVAAEVDTAGLLSDFSSHGLSAALTFKPDVAAPGGGIYATVPLELGAYDALSGTSMAAPHVAGAVALLLGARPELPARRVRDVLQNSAVPAPWGGDPGSGVPEGTHRQGAGLIRIDRAIRATTVITPGKLALGESEAGPAARALTLENTGGGDVTYDLSHVPAASATGGDHWAPRSATTGAARVDFGAPSVTVPARGSAAVSVTITANDALADGSLFGGYLVFTPRGGPEAGALRVPYAGFKGDYQRVPVLSTSGQGAPWLGKLSGTRMTPQPSGATYTMASGDIPYVVVHLDHGAERLILEVAEAATAKPWGQALSLSRVGQSASPTAAARYGWKGKTTLDRRSLVVPDGEYRITLRVLKALGDPGNAAHWETWTSPVVTLDRP